MSRPRSSGRRQAICSPSPRATRPRWVRRWAMISRRRSIRLRRSAGPAHPSMGPIRRCPRAPSRSRTPPRPRVTPPAELARRLAQIGVVDRALGPTLVAQLKPGQRLVSLEGDLWRWDGFAAASNAPTAAARRLAAKNRLADLDAELGHARTDLEGKR